ncbi:MAG: dTDP-4-dehydrorhamnose reductase [Cellvibrionales bacterium]|nr:dTDP-4-dehydrorhamnose reductase [Cellvibrionales bacterium]
MSPRILLSGASGQLGLCLIERAAALGVDLISLDRAALDITDRNAMTHALTVHNPDFFINAAAYTKVDHAEQSAGKNREQAFAVNATGVANVAAACAAQNVALIHLSTDYVFAGQARHPYTETDSPSPQGVYAASKLAGEKACVEQGGRHLIIRTGWLYSEHGHNFLKTMLRLAITKKRIAVVADQYGCPTYAGDLAAAILQICIQGRIGPAVGGLYHYAGPTVCSWSEFARIIFRQAQAQGQLAHCPQVMDISSANYAAAAPRPAYSALNSTKFQHTFGIKIPPLKESLNAALYALRHQNEN